MKGERESLEKQVQMHMKMNFTAFIIWLLSKKSMHGYAIIKTLAEIHPQGSAAANRIYPMLNELEKKGYIVKRYEKEGKRRKIIYSPTKKGINLLNGFKEEFKHPLLKSFVKEMMG